MSYWTDEELARFGFFILDGAQSPGTIVAIAINGVELKYDSVNGFGLSGEFLRFTGLGLAEVTFTVRLVDEEDRAAEDAAAWQRATAPPVQGQVDRIRTLGHPVLERLRATTNRWRMQSVPVDLPATAEGGGVTVEYRFKNDRKPLPQVGKPKAPSNAVVGKVPNFADEAIDAVGELLTIEIARGNNR